MKTTFNWIKDYIDFNGSAEELAEGLTMSGSEVGAIESFGEDKVLELEITSNRPDCLNILGLAREASAVFDIDLKTPGLTSDFSIREQSARKIECSIEDDGLCPFYSARVIEDVKVGLVDPFIRARIEPIGLRAINNIVDVANFCLMELGQPMHAFDLDKINGDKIIIRRAVKGEKIVTIDGVDRKLEAGMLVIADIKRPIAIAGVMGGLETEVTEKTKNILLESAYFDPLSIRRTARSLSLSTDSSYRFERGVEKRMVTIAADRATHLIIKESGGKLTYITEAGDLRIQDKEVEMGMDRLAGCLGIEIDRKKLINIFDRLGINKISENGELIKFNIPGFREDIVSEVDLFEEAARIYGYHNVPATIPEIFPEPDRKSYPREIKEKISDELVSMGLLEIMTYSLINEDKANLFPSFSGRKAVLFNALSEEHSVLTPHLFDGMLKSIKWNLNRKNEDISFFEIGKAYSKKKGGYQEKDILSIGFTGCIRNNWLEGQRECGIFDIKGTVERLFDTLRLNCDYIPLKIEEFSVSAGIVLDGGNSGIGVMGGVREKILREYDIEKPVYLVQVELDDIYKKAKLSAEYSSVPKFPFSSRDISILYGKNVAASDIKKVIKASGKGLIQHVYLVDLYKGDKISEDKTSLTYRIEYGREDRTLTDEEVESVHGNIKTNLSEKLKVTFR